MTKEEIIKAADCCAGKNGVTSCRYCPMYENIYCERILMKESLNLINQQSAEIEQLKSEYSQLQQTMIKAGMIMQSSEMDGEKE